MALTSPGSQITIVDESQYLPAAAGPRPLIVVASGENKTNSSGTGIATGTLASNAGKVQLVASQRDLATQFGVPSFPVVNGAVQQGSELNEYGLLAAHSFLGVASTAYIMRADVDTTQLVASGTAPTGAESSGTYWLDLTSSIWGLLEWNAVQQTFSAIAPILISDPIGSTNTTQITGGFPKSSVGVAGNYALYFNTNSVTPTVTAFYKGARSDLSQNWTVLGSDGWKQSHTTIVTTNTLDVVTAGSLKIKAAGAVSFESIASAGSAATLVTNLNADVTLNAFMKAFQLSNNSIAIYSSKDIVIDATSTAGLLTDLGLTANTYFAPALQQSKHTSVPPYKTTSATPRPTGSVWFKTTSPNSGANIVAKRRSGAGDWVAAPCPLYTAGDPTLYEDNYAATSALASDGVTASTIPTNTLYVRYNIGNLNEWVCQIEQWEPTIPLVVAGVTAHPSFTNGNSFSVVTGGGLTYTVTLNTGAPNNDPTTADGMAAAFSRANIPNMQMSVTLAGTLKVSHLTGNDFALVDGTGTPLATAGLAIGLASNWTELAYIASAYEPRVSPANGTLWYNSVLDEVDIMVQNGSSWAGYLTAYPLTDPKGPIISASQPDFQSDNTALAAHDLWIDTSDLENYPVIRRYNGSSWDLVDNKDHTTDLGIVFADVRSRVDGTSSSSSTIVDLLSSAYVDLDAPDPAEYPQGMLLFNLRRSGYNVKEYRVNYFNATSFPSMSLPAFTDSWVSKVTVDGSGAPYMGRKAQRRVIVVAMQAAVTSSLDARQEQNDFNLIAAPGYPELTDEMVGLNTDRKGTAFVLVDPPFRLQPTAAAVQAWAINSNSALTNGEDGLVTLDDYAAVYYPNGYATELMGNDVMVPASHMMLRTIALNDQVAYPWFAPAGLRRGVVNNATSVGYLDSTGQFVPAPLGQGQRDIMYENRVNPIVIQPTGGIVVFGQKTLAVTTSALDRVNVARLVVYVRTQLDTLVKPYLFEPNDTLTRNQVKQSIESFFNELVGQRALYDFLVVCDTSNNTPDRIDRNEMWVDIAIKPVKAIEFIYIPIRIVNTGASLSP